jgi:hypothetical protein
VPDTALTSPLGDGAVGVEVGELGVGLDCVGVPPLAGAVLLEPVPEVPLE